MSKKPSLQAMMDKLATLVDEVIKLQKIEDEAPNPSDFVKKYNEFWWTNSYLGAKSTRQFLEDRAKQKGRKIEIGVWHLSHSKKSIFYGKCKTRPKYPAKTKDGKRLQELAQEVWDLSVAMGIFFKLERRRTGNLILVDLENMEKTQSALRKLQRRVKKAYPNVNTEGVSDEMRAQHWAVVLVYGVLDTAQHSLGNRRKRITAEILPQAVSS